MQLNIDNKQLFFEFPTTNNLKITSKLKNYVVLWQAEDICQQINKLLAQNTNNLLLVDEKVWALHGKNINHPSSKILPLPAEEKFKQLESVTKVYDFLLKNNFNKNNTLIVVGGGIIQEIGSFVSASFKRGINWIFFPTTLLAMADSCIGGKTSLNYQGAKNQLGLFYPPSQIIINPNFLQTLNLKEIQSGLGEILKACIIGGNESLATYQKLVENGQVQNFINYKDLVFLALAVKKAVIEQDEFEENIRKVLNYGHTVGHAIESLSDFQIPHGLAVIIGMLIANKLAVQENLLSLNSYEQIKNLCLDLLTEDVINLLSKINLADLNFYLQQDKKVFAEKIMFVLLKQPGDLIFKTVSSN